MKMETKDKSVGLRIDRQVYEQAMLFKEIGRSKGDAAAYSTQAWFSKLIMKGIEKMQEEGY